MLRKLISLLTAVAMLCYTLPAGGAEAEVEENARITVLTGGETCEVLIDGDPVGRSPLSRFVTPGKHHIQVESESGEVKEQVVTAEANETVTARFKFDLPEPVKDAARGDFHEPGHENEGWSDWEYVGVSIGGVVLLGGAIVLAYNDDDDSTGGLNTVRVSQHNITLSVRTNLDTADGDQIDLIVNGAVILDNHELTTSDTTVAVTLNNGTNLVEIHADNEGTSPPNTGRISISNVSAGDAMQTWSVSGGSDAELVILAP